MKILLTVISLCLGISFAYNMVCPDVSQWPIRARLLCPDPSKYYCLWDGNAHVFIDNCSKVDYTAPGKRLVIHYNFDAELCSKDVYQPFIHWTNESSGCKYKKATCNEEGQVIYDDTITYKDVKCTCDYTRGYDFITRPKNPCYCIPSEEDCSCYFNPCRMSGLQYDNRCINTTFDYKQNCLPFRNDKKDEETTSIDEHKEQTTETSSERVARLTQVPKLLVIAGIVLSLVAFIAVFFVRKDDDGQTEKEDDIESLSVDRPQTRVKKYQFQGLFTEINSLGVETVEQFKEMLSAGSYKCFWNRVYLAGTHNVGKTTLAKNLVGDPVPETRESTDGIWIYLGRAGMDTEERKWIFLESGTALNATVQSFLITSKKEESVKQTMKTNDEDNRPQEKDSENSSKENDSEHTPVTSPERSTDQPEQVQDQHDNNAIADPLPASENRQTDIGILKLQHRDEETTKDDDKQHEVDLINEEIMKLVMAACKEGKYKMKIVPIDLWDFSGQKIYNMTHQLFISSRGTFVIVFNGSLDIHKEFEYLAYIPGQHGRRTIAMYLIHWVNSILTYCQTSKEGFPKILFVATHKDLVTKNVEKQREKLTASIEKLFENHTGKPHLQIRPLIFVNAKDKSDPGVNDLRKILVDTAFSHPRSGEPMPSLFVPLELQLTKNGKKIMKRTEIEDLNAENETMALKSSQLETFLKLQHALGKYIYFDEGHLKDFVVIDPTYLIEVLRSVVTEEQFWPKDKELRDIFVKLKETGTIRKVDLLKLWGQKDFCHILPFKEYMIEMLIHLDIIIELRSSITTNQSKMSEEKKFYLVPCMIPQPNKTPVDRKDTGIHMAYTFFEEIIPPAFLYRFLGSFISMWKMKSLYTDSAVVSIDKVHELTVNVDKNRLVVTLVHAENKKDIVPTIASTVQEKLTRAIVGISQFYWAASDSDSTTEKAADNPRKKTVVEFSKDTNCNQERNQKRIIPFEIEFGVHCTSRLCFLDHNMASEIANYKWTCEHKIMHDTSELKKWFAEKSLDFARKDEVICDTGCPGLGALLCERLPSDKHIGRLANALPLDEFRSLYYQLGLTSEMYEELEINYPNLFDLKFFALWQWKKSCRNRKFEQLEEAFKQTGYNPHRLCEVFREIEIKDILQTAANTEKRLMDPPKDEFLDRLSNNIGTENVQLGIELEITGEKLQEIVVKHKRNIMKQTREILREWKQQNQPCNCLAKACNKIHILGVFLRCFEDCYG